MGKSKKAYITFTVLILCLCLVPVIAISPNAQTTSNYTYEIVNGTATITGYKGKETEVVIPWAYHGDHVTKIGPSVFNVRKDITKITLPQGLFSNRNRGAAWYRHY